MVRNIMNGNVEFSGFCEKQITKVPIPTQRKRIENGAAVGYENYSNVDESSFLSVAVVSVITTSFWTSFCIFLGHFNHKKFKAQLKKQSKKKKKHTRRITHKIKTIAACINVVYIYIYIIISTQHVK